MKPEAVISKRLRNLRVRYTLKYVKVSQARCHRNCTYNQEHVPRGKITRDPEVEFERAPRKSVTLVVLQNEGPVRLCMYGADKPSSWKGDLCESDEIAASCPWFRPLVSSDEAKAHFEELLQDNDYVYENYRDVATLQWVLDDLVANKPLSLLERFKIWWSLWRDRRSQNRVLPPPSTLPELPADLWDHSDPQ